MVVVKLEGTRHDVHKTTAPINRAGEKLIRLNHVAAVKQLACRHLKRHLELWLRKTSEPLKSHHCGLVTRRSDRGRHQAGVLSAALGLGGLVLDRRSS